MDPVTPALIGSGVLLSGFLYKYWRLLHWQRIVTSCGLSVVKVSSPFALRKTIEARRGTLAVRIKGALHDKGGARVVITIPGPPGFSGLRLRNEHYKPLGAREIEVGDKSFDRLFYIEGPMRLALPLFNEKARRLLITAGTEILSFGKPLEIRGGELRVDTVDRDLATVLPLLLDIGEQLAQPMDVAQRLAENATLDPEAGVRSTNLLLLARGYSGEPGTLEVLRSASSDPSPEVRLRAARELGAEGRDVLLELAENPADDALSAQAISILGPELPFERAKAILVHALRRRRHQTARACVESLGRSGDAMAVGVLAKVMTREKGELATAAALALRTAGSPAAEGALIQTLLRDQKDLQVAAASALGPLGSPAAVLPLKELAERFEGDPEITRATRQAIAEIQSRLPGASPGQLSLAGAEVGQLTLAPGEAGQLSLSEDD